MVISTASKKNITVSNKKEDIGTGNIRPDLFKNKLIYTILEHLKKGPNHYLQLNMQLKEVTCVCSSLEEPSRYYENIYSIQSLLLFEIMDSSGEKGYANEKPVKFKPGHFKSLIDELNWFILKERNSHFCSYSKTEDAPSKEPQTYPLWSFTRLLGTFMKVPEDNINDYLAAGQEKLKLEKITKIKKMTNKINKV